MDVSLDDSISDNCFFNLRHKGTVAIMNNKVKLYGDLPKMSEKIAARQPTLTGHCQCDPELPANKLLLWKPTHGGMERWRPTKTWIALVS